MTLNRTARIVFPLAASLLAVVLVGFSLAMPAYEVNDQPASDPEELFILFEKISEPQMIIEATYSGVARSPEGSLFFTYDRTAAKGGHKPCPT